MGNHARELRRRLQEAGDKLKRQRLRHASPEQEKATLEEIDSIVEQLGEERRAGYRTAARITGSAAADPLGITADKEN